MIHTKPRKALVTLLVIGAVGAVASFGVFSAFSSATTNSGNSFSAGTVAISSNDASTAMFQNVTGAKPTVAVTKCITITYTGSLAATVKAYTSDSALSGSLGQYTDVTITPGSFSGAAPSFPSCTGFTPDAGGAVFTGTLSAFNSTKTSYGAGVTLPGPSSAAWAHNDAVTYQFSYTVQDNNSANSQNFASPSTTGTHSYTFEAHNN